MLILISTINTKNITDDKRINGGTSEIQDETNLNNPKTSRSWWNNFSFIHIDGNWSTAAGYEWCRGDGSWSNPYVIENITIDAISSPTESGIFINNSKNEYFVIRNCTVYNSPGSWFIPNAGIKLENTNNGTLTLNNCSNNNVCGILLINTCENNTITDNIVNNGQNIAIYLTGYCRNNTVSGNTVNNNGVHGVRLNDYSEDNIVSGNIINDNGQYGITVSNNCHNNTNWTDMVQFCTTAWYTIKR